MQKLYLLSVVTPRDLQLFKINVEYTAELNKEKDVTWIIVCNGDGFEFVNFRVQLENIGLGNIHFIFHNFDFSTLPKNKLHQQSFEHGFGINYGVKNSKLDPGTLIVIDPDFIFIRANWLCLILKNNKLRRRGVIGTSWDPARLKDWGDFPAPHFMALSTDRALRVDFTPRDKNVNTWSSNRTHRNHLNWINQRIETGSKLRSRNQVIKSSLLKFQLMIIFNLHQLFPGFKLISENYLFGKVKKIQLSGGIIFDHSHSYRSKKALKTLIDIDYWYLFPEITFRYLVFLRNKMNFNNVNKDFFVSPLEFLNYGNEKVAVHARSVGTKFVSRMDLELYLNSLNLAGDV